MTLAISGIIYGSVICRFGLTIFQVNRKFMGLFFVDLDLLYPSEQEAVDRTQWKNIIHWTTPIDGDTRLGLVFSVHSQIPTSIDPKSQPKFSLLLTQSCVNGFLKVAVLELGFQSGGALIRENFSF